VNDDTVLQVIVGSFQLIVPEMVLGLVAGVLFLGATFRASRHVWGTLAVVGLLVAGAFLWAIDWGYGPSLQRVAVFAGPLVADPLALMMKCLALATGLVLVLLSWNEVPDRHAPEYHACLLVIIAGMSLTAASNDLVALFLALELISIPTYVLLYLPRHDSAAQEAAMKYFLLSVFSSALMLFGFSYLYGMGGTTNLPALFSAFTQAPGSREVPGLAAVALIMIMAGLGFRITAVPFHFYAPDVYEGTPTVVAALLAYVPKVAGFVALLRVLGFVLPAGSEPQLLIGMGLSDQVPILLWFLAAVTMFVGNVLGLLQDNLKRLLAYSSVAHAGYMLIALAVAPYLRWAAGGAAASGPDGLEALLFYLVAYGLMTVGAFGVIAYLSTPERPVETVDDLAGLSRSHPGVAALMAIFLFSLIGIPLTAGFTGKLMVFFGAMAVPSSEHATLFRVLALLGVINAAIGAWYYLRIVAVMYLRTSVLQPAPRPRLAGKLVLWICAVLTIGLSIPPGAEWLLRAARQAAGVGQGLPPVAAQRQRSP
jgi:NADH-quinone oxidoreductase subunit N